MEFFKKEKLDELLAVKHAPRHTILLVDDEPNNLKVLTAILETQYHILHAADGQEALERVHQHGGKLAMVISDQRMPRLTGVQLFEQLCHLTPDTMRIIVTGHIDVDAIIDSINRAHIYHFVLKPFDRADFEKVVEQAIAVYEKQQQLQQQVHTLGVSLAGME